MINRGTLRGQLTLVYTVALVVGLTVFGAISLLVFDRSARSSLDQHLLSEARTISAVLDVRHGKIIIEETDRTQFTQIIGVKLSGAVYDAAGRQLLTTSVPVPSQIRALVTTANHGTFVTTVGPVDGQVRAAIVPLFDGAHYLGCTVLWRSIDMIQDQVWRLAAVFAFAIPVIVAFAIFFGTLVAKRGLLPLRKLADLASDIEAHDLSRRLAVNSERDELERLCATFDRMLGRLEGAFERERRFTSDASHELRGPLSVMRAEAELALRRTRDPGEYERILQTIITEVDALERLTSDLLAAARAESAATASHQQVDACAALMSVCGRLEVLAQSHGVTLEHACTRPLFVSSSEPELTRIIFAIVHNAIKYSGNSTTVRARLAAEGSFACLTVTDEGSGFTQEALEHAFDRFWRDDAARAREGNGLGLSITKRILDDLGATIRLRNSASGGAIVEVRLPLRTG